MKVRVKLEDVLVSYPKNAKKLDKNGDIYVTVEAEPVEEKKEPKWCDKINEWLKPRPLHEISFDIEKGIKEFVYDGKPLRELIKNHIKDLLKQFANDIIYEHHNPNCNTLPPVIDKIKKKWGVE